MHFQIFLNVWLWRLAAALFIVTTLWLWCLAVYCDHQKATANVTAKLRYYDWA